ncbi:MAG: 3-demethylubiquinone-9 3-methyltransferase [Frankiales bacterium]|nr:3-demethylubiquinone-9 3-methyltransferase [Frankiales bacterium]
MSTITPHLWFDTQAREAAEFYAVVFPHSSVTHVTTLHGTPSGDCDLVAFQVWGQDFMAISAGPEFTINPSISFIVNFDPIRDANAAALLDQIWPQLVDGGKVLMPLDAYPFSSRYGWVQDRYGVSWQLMLTNPAGEPRPAIIPALTFVGDVAGKAEEATDSYLDVFAQAAGGSERGQLVRYPEGMAPDVPGTVVFSDLRLGDTWLTAMDSAREHDFAFNEAVSLVVQCSDQTEIDRYSDQLSAVPEAEQCGWIKDRWGVSWQITPIDMNDMLVNGTDEQVARVTEAFLSMKRFDVATLRAAYSG